MKEKLAIVIPAYKADFLRDALESIASQTSQQFHLYIGDDNSPQDLYSIVRSFEGRIDLTYKKFDANLGGQDLVAHWDRCIDLTHDEEWIWLFSDDDVMGSDCVETFFEGLRQNEGTDLFHFNIKVIDRNGQPVKTCNPFPERMAVNDFFSQRISTRSTALWLNIYFQEKSICNPALSISIWPGARMMPRGSNLAATEELLHWQAQRYISGKAALTFHPI